jgi:hypothetical protein
MDALEIPNPEEEPRPPREVDATSRRAAGARRKHEPPATPDAAFEQGGAYWDNHIDENVAGAFLGLTGRSLQKYRMRGDGPEYVRISERCIRYTRRRLKRWADARARRSTSDPGEEAP